MSNSKHDTHQEFKSGLDRLSKLPETVDILGVPVYKLDRKTLTALFKAVVTTNMRGWFSSVNVHAINLAQELPWFKQFIRDSLLTYCDGDGVRLGSWILGKPLPEKIGLTYWIYDLLEVMESEGLKVYFLGSTDTILERAVEILRRKFPRLQIVGYHSGYFSMTDNQRIIDSINTSKPNLLIVGMGMPKQERWILDHHSVLTVPLITNAGACFDSIASDNIRVRTWASYIGLEWLYRLILEPRRLWRRYLIGNPTFIMRCLRARFQR